MENIVHKTVAVNGINMHVAELGEGPVILFLHGFPELWYTWRHQMLYFSSHGYRAVAPDLRGYGDTTGAPITDSTKFTTLHVVGDLVALIDAVAADQEKVFVVGHDWGANIAWALCLYRPDKVKALVNLSVEFWPRNPKFRPIDALRKIYGDDYYMVRFQEPGSIEADFAQNGTERVIRKFLTYRNPGPLMLPKGNIFGDSPDTPIPLPPWFLEEDVAYYTSKYEQTGFTGGLNYYRSLNLLEHDKKIGFHSFSPHFDRNWELTAPWTGAQVKVPTKFIVGDIDLTYNSYGTNDYIHKGGFKKDVPLLEDAVVLEGVGHFLNEEKPDEINKLIHDYFNQFSA